MSDLLFSSIQVGRMSLASRIVMAPLTRSRAGAGNVPTGINVEYYRQRAGAALIITEATQISQQGQGYAWTPGIYSDAQVEGWRPIAKAVHEKGGHIFMQLWHVGRVSHPSFQPGGGLPVAPTAMPVEGKTFIVDADGNGTWADLLVPQELTLDGIKAIIADYATAAVNALAAGMDGIEIHAANGYLIDQFINSASNHRRDAYGGPVAHRARLLLEIVDAVIAVAGEDRVGVRLTPLGRFMGMGDDTPEETFDYIATALDRRKIAYLHAVEPTTFGVETDMPITPEGEAMMRLIRKRFSGTIIVAGGYDQRKAEQALADGRADMVAFGKLFISNPDLPVRFSVGAALNEADRATFFGGGAHGYTDYPSLPSSVTLEAIAG
ncbi:alkene reductase [Ancylobacter sp. Lp-2]|uniref:alkene reductase n=1 Tax=Ancylobacter sp. Lp-2 TaxID=2881339 RepID=UPI001E5BB1A6|nr:alkene reductase [Ancylobacter sp. Lp-2]MCB4767673.1 alkene reductase [Ancylobacter sp. Lp-2]